jgi:hypothetical protein
MTGLLAVTQRELTEKRRVLVAALVGGALPWLAPLLPGWPTGEVAEMRFWLAVAVAAGFGVGLAIMIGSTMISGELRARRFGFHLARPLSAGSVWFGKLLAGVLLVVSVVALTCLPTILLGGSGGEILTLRFAKIAFNILIGAVGLLAASHAVATMISSRSPLIALDLVAFVLVGFAFLIAGWPLTYAKLTWVPRAGALLALVLAGLAQVACGRSDTRRGHLALSGTLWGVLGTLAFATLGFAAWFNAATPADLVSVTGSTCAPRGPWISVVGRVAHRGGIDQSFLLDTKSGLFLRTGIRHYLPDLAFSADGTRAVYKGKTDGGRPSASFAVWMVDLGGNENVPRTMFTKIFTDHTWGSLRLSADGDRLAVWDENTLAVYDLPSGKQVVAVKLAAKATQRRWGFVSPQRIRLVSWSYPDPKADRGDVHIDELDIESRRLVTVGRTIGFRTGGYLLGAFDPANNRMISQVSEDGAQLLTLHDAVADRRLATLARNQKGLSWTNLFLADGRIALGMVEDGRAKLLLFTPQGAPIEPVDLGPAQRAAVGPQLAANQLFVRIAADRLGDQSTNTTLLVDLSTGRATPLLPGYVPATTPGWLPDIAGQPELGSPASRLFETPQGGLAELDSTTLAFRPVLSLQGHLR